MRQRIKVNVNSLPYAFGKYCTRVKMFTFINLCLY